MHEEHGKADLPPFLSHHMVGQPFKEPEGLDPVYLPKEAGKVEGDVEVPGLYREGLPQEPYSQVHVRLPSEVTVSFVKGLESVRLFSFLKVDVRHSLPDLRVSGHEIEGVGVYPDGLLGEPRRKVRGGRGLEARPCLLEPLLPRQERGHLFVGRMVLGFRLQDFHIDGYRLLDPASGLRLSCGLKAFFPVIGVSVSEEHGHPGFSRSPERFYNILSDIRRRF